MNQSNSSCGCSQFGQYFADRGPRYDNQIRKRKKRKKKKASK